VTLSGFDCWGFGPSPAAAKAAGRTFRTWYSSYDGSKDGPVDGPAQYAADGIWSVCNFETTIDRVLTGGYSGGQQDMMHAINEYVQRGMPIGAAVILSADEAIPAGSFGQALTYYQGARQAAAGQYLSGAYGEQALIAYLKSHGAIDIGWRTMSTEWPGGAATAYCDIIQTGSGTIGDVSVDYNTALVPFIGQWMPGKLAPRTSPPPQEIDMQDSLYAVANAPDGTNPGIWLYADGQYTHVPTIAERDLITTQFGIQQKPLPYDAHQVLLALTTPVTLTDAQVHALAAEIVPLLSAAPTVEEIAAAVTARLGSALSNG
jgi:hypothetical protein